MMQWVYYIVQIGVFVGLLIFNQEAELGGSGLAVGVISLGFAAILTGLIYWTIEGGKLLVARFRPKRNHRVIPPYQ
jgi:hypothetical protein